MMNNWTKTTLRDSLEKNACEYRISQYRVYEYGARDCLKSFNTVKELYEWLEAKDVSVKRTKYYKYQFIGGGRYSYSCEVRLDAGELGTVAKKRYIRNLLDESEALCRIERLRGDKWIKKMPEWLFDKIAYNKKIYVVGNRHGSLGFRSRASDFPVESNLTDKILDKVLESAGADNK